MPYSRRHLNTAELLLENLEALILPQLNTTYCNKKLQTNNLYVRKLYETTELIANVATTENNYAALNSDSDSDSKQVSIIHAKDYMDAAKIADSYDTLCKLIKADDTKQAQAYANLKKKIDNTKQSINTFIRQFRQIEGKAPLPHLLSKRFPKNYLSLVIQSSSLAHLAIARIFYRHANKTPRPIAAATAAARKRF